ncbi:DUF1801 domain-containing protein [Kineococcus sp. SYSU DK001]|uniref:DUF1801 domain-containing protein n=1 Tax=Kineococcus sp. SYSU DK001 TaxID=3383122 RepID=UPI003D7D9650
MRERAAELRTQARRGRASDKAAQKAAADAADVLAKIEGMPDGDRALARRVHEVVTAAAPDLAPKLYYGQPGYARDGKVVCFFRSGEADGLRYSTFGFSPQAELDEAGGLWPTSYALTGEATGATWERLARLVERAAGTATAADPEPSAGHR